MSDIVNSQPQATQNDEIFLWNPENIAVLGGDIQAYQPHSQRNLWLAAMIILFAVLIEIIIIAAVVHDQTMPRFFVTIAVFLILGILAAAGIGSLDFALRRGEMNRLRQQGVLIRGKLVSCKVNKRSSKAGYIYRVKLVGEFKAPDGHSVQCKGGGGWLYQSEMDVQPIPQVGDQVAVLYVTDNIYALL